MSLPDRASDAERRHLRLRGHRAAYVDEGSSTPAFVLVHGIPGDSRDWRWLCPVLAGQRRVVRLEMPGFGETDVELAAPSVHARAEFVLEMLAALELSRVVLVGHSMGGVVSAAAANLASRADSNAVAGVAFISSPGLRVHRGFKMAPWRVLEWALRSGVGARALRTPIERAFRASGFQRSTAAERAHSIRCVAATSIAQHVSELASLEQPRMSAFSLDDPLVDPDILEDTARALGGAVHRFPSGGHNPQKHYANELGAALVDFAGSLD